MLKKTQLLLYVKETQTTKHKKPSLRRVYRQAGNSSSVFALVAHEEHILCKHSQQRYSFADTFIKAVFIRIESLPVPDSFKI